MVLQGWLGWAVASAIFAALTAIFAKVGLKGLDSDFATLFRTAVILIVLTGLVVATGKWRDPRTLERKTVIFLVLSALATSASWSCYFRALKLGNASQVAPVDKLSVVLVAIFAFAFLGERPTSREWIAISLIGAGAVMLSLKR